MVSNCARFFTAFLRQPGSMGAVAPSSRWLAARMTEGVRLDQAKVVVEIGAGTGAFTGAIQEKLHPEAAFLVVEINPDFARYLTPRFPRARVIHGSAEHLSEFLSSHGHATADCVLSGLPWAGFSNELQQRLLSSVVGALRPGGEFATFAYNHASWLPRGRRFRRLLETRFPSVRTTPMVWRNLPPAFVYHCRKMTAMGGQTQANGHNCKACS